jgi:hypothetical protein
MHYNRVKRSDSGTYRENHKEEWPEMVEHLCEEIPPQSRVGRQIREGQAVAVELFTTHI